MPGSLSPGNVFTLAGLAVALACGRTEYSPRDSAGGEVASTSVTRVRFIDALGVDQPVDVYADSSPRFRHVTFAQVTPYQDLPDGHPTLAVRPAGYPDSTVLARAKSVPLAGTYYTVIAMSGKGRAGARLEVLRDDEPPDDPDKGRLRIVHTARNTGSVDVAIAGSTSPLFDDVDFQDRPRRADVVPGTFTILIRRHGSNSELLRIPDVTLQAGAGLTVVLIKDGDRQARLDAVKVVDTAEPADSVARKDSSR